MSLVTIIPQQSLFFLHPLLDFMSCSPLLPHTLQTSPPLPPPQPQSALHHNNGMYNPKIPQSALYPQLCSPHSFIRPPFPPEPTPQLQGHTHPKTNHKPASHVISTVLPTVSNPYQKCGRRIMIAPTTNSATKAAAKAPSTTTSIQSRKGRPERMARRSKRCHRRERDSCGGVRAKWDTGKGKEKGRAYGQVS